MIPNLQISRYAMQQWSLTWFLVSVCGWVHERFVLEQNCWEELQIVWHNCQKGNQNESWSCQPQAIQVCRESSDYILSTCLDQFCWDDVDSRWLPFLMDLHWPCSCIAQSNVQFLILFCEAFSWTIFNSSWFPLFHSGQIFYQLVCPLTVVLPQIFFNLITLFSYPVFLSLFHAPLKEHQVSQHSKETKGVQRRVQNCCKVTWLG